MASFSNFNICLISCKILDKILVANVVFAYQYKIPLLEKGKGHISRFGGSKQFLAGVSAKLGRGSKVEVWPMPSLIADGRDANNTRG